MYLMSKKASLMWLSAVRSIIVYSKFHVLLGYEELVQNLCNAVIVFRDF